MVERELAHHNILHFVSQFLILFNSSLCWFTPWHPSLFSKPRVGKMNIPPFDTQYVVVVYFYHYFGKSLKPCWWGSCFGTHISFLVPYLQSFTNEILPHVRFVNKKKKKKKKLLVGYQSANSHGKKNKIIKTQKF